jgi:hypothetical protein
MLNGVVALDGIVAQARDSSKIFNSNLHIYYTILHKFGSKL